MKTLFVAVLSALVSVSLLAVPAERSRRNVRLNDGRVVTARLVGDEHFSALVTDDGLVVERDAAGLLHLTSRRLTDVVPASLSDEPSPSASAAPRRIGSQATAPLPAQGRPRIPVVLVNFADSTFSVAPTDAEVAAYYDLYCNGTRDGRLYKGHGSYGSINDYFTAQSDSIFQPEFVIIGPVTLDKPEAQYGSNSGNSKDTGYSAFRSEVIRKATAQYTGKWEDFDNRGRSSGSTVYVDMIFFIFAGCGENTADFVPTLLWPKESKTPETVSTDDGRKIVFSASGCCSENRCTDWATDASGKEYVTAVEIDGIGVMCHELSHALGLPDFYDTNYVGFGMDVWSLMDWGCYMYNSYRPVAYTAYERDFMGWRPLRTIDSPGYYELSAIASDKGEGLKVVNPDNTNEYFVLEARLSSGWDQTLAQYGKGLQVTHVDYDATAWNSNRVNTNASRQRMTIVAANNRYEGTTVATDVRTLRTTWAGNLFPFEQNDSLTATSVPAWSVYTAGGVMPHSLTDIVCDGDVVGFWFDKSLFDAVHDARPTPSGSDEPFFDLSGRRVDSPRSRGIYVQRGHKVVY